MLRQAVRTLAMKDLNAMPFELVTVPCLSDNYAFLTHDAASGETALIDIPEAGPILEALETRGWTLSTILITHHHYDHIDGLEGVLAKHKARVIGAEADAGRLPPLDVAVKEGDSVAALKGKPVNLVELSVSHYLLARGLESVGLAEKDISVVNTSDADMVAAFAAPDVEAAVNKCADTFGEIDMVLAGQAGNFPAGAAQMSANAFKTVIDIDLLGTFNVFRAAIHRCKRPGASFIAISAPQGKDPWLYQSHVCAAKAGVNMLVKCCALEWGIEGVRVNAISPGPIDGTEGMARLAPTDQARHEAEQALALKRFGSRDDIAEAALWLCSEGAGYVTGTILEVEGGTTVGDASKALRI